MVHLTSLIAATALTGLASAAVVWVDPYNLPQTTEQGQTGYNNCPGRADSPSANCQTLWLNSALDFCLWAPRTRNTVGNSEADVVAWCTKPGHGARLIPKGALKSVHYVKTPHYIQITGTGDFTKMNVPAGDEGGELDPHGADGKGNPVGGIVLQQSGSTKYQLPEWNEYLAYNEFSIRACFNGPEAARYHIYDVMGSMWNHPGNYGSGFEKCIGKDVAQPMGVYSKNGGLSTWYQGVNPTPSAQPAPPSSRCTQYRTVGGASYCTSHFTLPCYPSHVVAPSFHPLKLATTCAEPSLTARLSIET